VNYQPILSADVEDWLQSTWSREAPIGENTSGLIRQYFPKDRGLTTVTKYNIEKAMDTLNRRPGKSLGYRTPCEVFSKTRTSLTVSLPD